jgi:gliding motility-associated-like protein
MDGNPDEGGIWEDELFLPAEMPFEPVSSPTILYYINESNGCADTAQLTILIRPVPTVLVESEENPVDEGESVQLSASGAETYTWTPDGSLTCADCADPLFLADTTTIFQVIGENEFGCQDTASITIEVISQKEPALPNIFTPNGDGMNDNFQLLFAGSNIVEYKLEVYARWGQLVFETSDPNAGWDGNYEEKPAPSDVYVYQMSYRLSDGTSKSESGEVTLLR